MEARAVAGAQQSWHEPDAARVDPIAGRATEAPHRQASASQSDRSNSIDQWVREVKTHHPEAPHEDVAAIDLFDGAQTVAEQEFVALSSSRLARQAREVRSALEHLRGRERPPM